LIGPFPCPNFLDVLIPASTYRQALFTALTTSIPLARFDEIAAIFVKKDTFSEAGDITSQ
jgi:hypothetical protein